MDELTLGLISAGAVVVAGVLAHNAWQGAKIRRRMPKSVPQDTAAPFAEDGLGDRGQPLDGDASLFIELAPGMGRREPSFNAIAPLDVPVDIQAEAGVPDSDPIAISDFRNREDEGVNVSRNDGDSDNGDESRDDDEPKQGAAALPANAPAVPTTPTTGLSIIDRRIDCIIPISLSASLGGEKLIVLAQRLRRAGSKPVHIEGQPENGDGWELLQSGTRYQALRAAVQLANRGGALNELEFSEFVSGVRQFADAIDGEPEIPDMFETVTMARELDGFAAQCDAQLSINILSDGPPWSANYLQAVASQDGLLLSRDGMRFVKLDAKQNPVFMLQFGDTNFLRDDLTYKGGQMATLILDVPIANGDILPFAQMCDYATSLAQRIGGRIVDDQRRVLSEAALLAIEKQLTRLYAKLDEAGIPAGCPVTRRLFSG